MRIPPAAYVLLALAIAAGTSSPAQQTAVIQMEYTNAQLYPSHWILKLNPDGSGHFDSDGGQPPAATASKIVVAEVHRDVQLSPQFAAQVFTTARHRRWFAFNCESHLKVAFQGTKKLSYAGPEGSGSCGYNYSKDKEIQSLGDSLVAVEATVLYGAKLEKLLQHDRLGIDQEMENLATAIKDGTAIEVGTIRETLNRIASDQQVMERARRKARKLLADSGDTAAAQASVQQ